MRRRQGPFSFSHPHNLRTSFGFLFLWANRSSSPIQWHLCHRRLLSLGMCEREKRERKNHFVNGAMSCDKVRRRSYQWVSNHPKGSFLHSHPIHPSTPEFPNTPLYPHASRLGLKPSLFPPLVIKSSSRTCLNRTCAAAGVADGLPRKRIALCC